MQHTVSLLLYSPGVINVTLSESLLPKMSVTVIVAVCSPGAKSNTSMSSTSKPTGGEFDKCLASCL